MVLHSSQITQLNAKTNISLAVGIKSDEMSQLLQNMMKDNKILSALEAFILHQNF